LSGTVARVNTTDYVYLVWPGELSRYRD